MTNDEKMELVSSQEDLAWLQLRSMSGDKVRSLEVIERCQRIRAGLQSPGPTTVSTPGGHWRWDVMNREWVPA